MMASVRYVPNRGFKAVLLNSAGVMAAVDEAAAPIQRRAASMFGATAYVLRKAQPGKVRCHAFVATADRHAMNSNAMHMTLQKALKG